MNFHQSYDCFEHLICQPSQPAPKEIGGKDQHVGPTKSPCFSLWNNLPHPLGQHISVLCMCVCVSPPFFPPCFPHHLLTFVGYWGVVWFQISTIYLKGVTTHGTPTPLQDLPSRAPNSFKSLAKDLQVSRSVVFNSCCLGWGVLPGPPSDMVMNYIWVGSLHFSSSKPIRL